MWKAVWGLATIIGKMFEYFEQVYAEKRQAHAAKIKAKAENYDKLQRALKARGAARRRFNAGELPDDKYSRDK